MMSKEELAKLTQATGELAQQALSGQHDLAAAQLLDAQLAAVRDEAQASSALWLTWQEARRYLDVAVAAMQPREETIVEKAFRLSQELFHLAQLVAGGQIKDELREQARRIDAELRALPLELLPETDRVTVEQTISEGQLDVLYVLADGNAPTSLRLFYFRQAQGNSDVS
ncbi:MAG: hypothetical protein HC804_07705 [Anaerolineae bacterium]|nr:hypothetical protein [Anaerolineae bacterium]